MSHKYKFKFQMSKRKLETCSECEEEKKPLPCFEMIADHTIGMYELKIAKLYYKLAQAHRLFRAAREFNKLTFIHALRTPTRCTEISQIWTDSTCKVEITFLLKEHSVSYRCTLSYLKDKVRREDESFRTSSAIEAVHWIKERL